MKISEAKNTLKGINLEAVVTKKGDARNVNLKAGGVARVAEVIIDDDSGSMTLSLWNEEIDKVKVGSKITIENGYTNQFKGNVKLNIGKYGKLTVK